ncbi:hypothetical protein [Bremerella cremea]|uniref:hypothetical protein n=1 Tax=Bremerella cremea TaxID=1031537 RepID=UPI0031F009FA
MDRRFIAMLAVTAVMIHCVVGCCVRCACACECFHAQHASENASFCSHLHRQCGCLDNQHCELCHGGHCDHGHGPHEPCVECLKVKSSFIPSDSSWDGVVARARVLSETLPPGADFVAVLPSHHAAWKSWDPRSHRPQSGGLRRHLTIAVLLI